MRRRDLLLAGSASGVALVTAVGLVVTLVVLVVRQEQQVAFDGPPRFVLTWAQVPERLAVQQDRLHDSRVLHEAVDDVNERVRLDRHVEVRVRSCRSGSFYDYADRRIAICLEDETWAREDLDSLGDPDPETSARLVLRETVAHEAGHAVIAALDVPFDGSEEDAADEFAAWALLDGDPDGAEAVAAAARQYAALADLQDTDTSEGHSLDRERAADYACWVRAADPRGDELVGDVRWLGRSRMPDCPREWRALQARWTQRIDSLGALRG